MVDCYIFGKHVFEVIVPVFSNYDLAKMYTFRLESSMLGFILSSPGLAAAAEVTVGDPPPLRLSLPREQADGDADEGDEDEEDDEEEEE